MSALFQNKYRITPARLQTWNYANEGMYFVTICTKNRECYFGEIVETPVETRSAVETPCMASLQPACEPKMQLSEIGKIAENEWIKTIELRPDMNLELGEYVVMPNHFHGIIIIGENEFNDGSHAGPRRDAMHRVSTAATKKLNNNEPTNKFGPQSKNLSSILRGYKSAVTTYAKKNNILFNWQSRFHDHIIRSMDEYYRISNYIINNPANWRSDDFYKQ